MWIVQWLSSTDHIEYILEREGQNECNSAPIYFLKTKLYANLGTTPQWGKVPITHLRLGILHIAKVPSHIHTSAL